MRGLKMDNITTRFLTLLAALILSALAVMGGCGSSPPEKNTSKVTLAIGGAGKTANLTAVVPADVKTIIITIKGAGMVTMTKRIEVNGQQEIIEIFDVPNGTGRVFTVEALNSGGNPLYRSEAVKALTGAEVDIPLVMEVYVPTTTTTSTTTTTTSTGSTTTTSTSTTSTSTTSTSTSTTTTTTITLPPTSTGFACDYRDTSSTDHWCAEFNFPLQVVGTDYCGTTASDGYTVTTLQACSRSNLVGGCSLLSPGTNSVAYTWFWYIDTTSSGPTAAEMQQACSATGGSWSPN